MGFSGKQAQALRRNLDSRHVRMREANGRELFYIEGWYAISEANRIFGFDGWNRETVESRCVLVRENRGTFLAVYVARVRITVHAAGTTIMAPAKDAGHRRLKSTMLPSRPLKPMRPNEPWRLSVDILALNFIVTAKLHFPRGPQPRRPKHLIRRDASDLIRTIQSRFLDLLVNMGIGKIRSFNTLATKIAAPITRQRMPNCFCLSRALWRQLGSIKVF